MPDCLSADQLVRLVEGAITGPALRALEQHIAGCRTCAAALGGLGGQHATLAMGSEGSEGGDGDAAVAAAAGAHHGRRVGRYQLDRRIAAGGMGEVWAAWDPQLRRDIAVKLVRPERARGDDGRERERLLREARALARLTHPNVLAVYDVGELANEVFIATELVVGDTLASRGGAGTDARALISLYLQAARGLAAAHAAGLVHRDVKPANLLLGADGRVRVADFGLAIRAHAPTPSPTPPPDPTASITATGDIAGTPAYMAPEQWAGEPADARADQYALCLALAEGLAGRRPPVDPMPGVPTIATRDLHAFLTERRPASPALTQLTHILARGLSKAPADRFPTTLALADALETILATWPVTDPSSPAAPTAPAVAPSPASAPTAPNSAPPTTPSPPSATPVRSRLALAAIVLAVAGLAVAATLWLQRATPPSTAPPPAVSSPVVSSPPVSSAPAPLPSSASLPAPAPAPSPPAAVPRSLAPSPPARPRASRVAAVTPPAAASAPSGSSSPPADPSIAVASAGTRAAAAPQVAMATPFDLSALLNDLRAALRVHDVAACRRLLAGAPAALPASIRFTLEMHAAFCDMRAGDCAGGTARLTRAYATQPDPAPDLEVFADQYCPITGDLDTRQRRLSAQVAVASFGDRWAVPACDRLLPAARALGRDVRTVLDRARAAHSLQRLATCLGSAGRCADAHQLWLAAVATHDTLRAATPDLTARCPATPPAVATLPATTFGDLSLAIRSRDTRRCAALLAALPTNLDPSQQTSVDLYRAHCDMVAGRCAAGRARLAALDPAAPAGPLPPAGPLRTQWLDANADTYCPIEGPLDARLRRLWAQVDAFTGRHPTDLHNTTWCTALTAPALTAATDASTPTETSRAAKILRRLATCLGAASRCTDALSLWTRAESLDPGTPTPSLTTNCP